MNTELLLQLYSIHSPSGHEKKMRRFIRKQAALCGASYAETDKYGNLLIVKGVADTYPCVAAHMDQVQERHSKDFRALETDDTVFGWSSKAREQQGLGADDKNGIFICLEMLRKFPVIKAAFFVGEETGCQGSSKVDLSFFSDCRFIIEPDRRGASDLITSMFCGDVCSEEFINDIHANAFGYKEDVGSITDVGELVERGVGISCLNLSCGYYNAHTDQEVTVLPELENCMNFVESIITRCQKVYPFTYTPAYHGYGRSYGRDSVFGYGKRWDDYDWDYERSSRDHYYDYGYGKQKEKYTVEYDKYLSDGYYDADYDEMESLLQLCPELLLDRIKGEYGDDFYAVEWFHHSEWLDEIYDDIKLRIEGSNLKVS